MWSLSLLPADILEDGFTGATLGIECAGTDLSRWSLGLRFSRWGPCHVICSQCAGLLYVVVPALHAVKFQMSFL